MSEFSKIKINNTDYKVKDETARNNINNLQSQINSLSSGSPLVASSIEEMTDTTKVYVNTTDGNWYYHNGTEWVIGGVYQASEIDMSKVNPNFPKETIINYSDNNLNSGYYSTENNELVIKESSSHKCVKVNIFNDNAYLNMEVLSALGNGLVVGYEKLNDGTLQNLGNKTLVNYPLKNVKELYINLFSTVTESFNIKYEEEIRSNNLNSIGIPKNSIKNEYEYNVLNLPVIRGYYENTLSVNKTSSVHKCIELPINNDNCSLSFEILDTLGISVGYLLMNDDTVVALGTETKTNLSLKNVKKLYFNFFEGFNESFILKYNDEESSNIEKYDDFVKSNYDFNGKSLCFAGDSITKGFTTGKSITENGYPKLFSDSVGASFSNIAVGGALYTEGYNEVSTLLTQITNTTNKNADYLFLAGGVNDCQLNVPIDEFKTAVSNTIDYALNNFTGEIIIITPINHVRPMESNVDNYINAITEVAILKNNDRISIVQGHKFNFPNDSSSSEFISAMYGDNIHPSELGYKTYTRGLIKALVK